VLGRQATIAPGIEAARLLARLMQFENGFPRYSRVLQCSLCRRPSGFLQRCADEVELRQRYLSLFGSLGRGGTKTGSGIDFAARGHENEITGIRQLDFQ
jgi:hypothetical protein